VYETDQEHKLHDNKFLCIDTSLGDFVILVLIASFVCLSDFSINKLFVAETDTDIVFICLILNNNNIQLVI